MQTTTSATTGTTRSPELALARVVVDPAFVLAPVRRRLFGSFVEHMGRCVYTGVYEPDHPTADEHGFRGDVTQLVDELGVTMVRYPGGNFVSGYRWEDGVGPREERPVTLDLAWRAIEPNQVGTDDFLAWCERTGVEPMMAVNLGTRGLTEAVDLPQYTNAEPGLTTADRRVANGNDFVWPIYVLFSPERLTARRAQQAAGRLHDRLPGDHGRRGHRERPRADPVRVRAALRHRGCRQQRHQGLTRPHPRTTRPM